MTTPENDHSGQLEQPRNWNPFLIVRGAALAILAVLWIITIVSFQSL